MSVDAIALLPLIGDLQGEVVEGDWMEGLGPAGVRGLWRRLRDGTLLNLGLPIQSPDGYLYEGARRWMAEVPEQIWVFPDTAVPDEDTAQQIQSATRGVGRWIKPGPKRQAMLEALGFSPDEEEELQREMNSGDAKRIQAAVASFEKRLAGRDPAEVEAFLAKILRRG